MKIKTLFFIFISFSTFAFCKDIHQKKTTKIDSAGNIVFSSVYELNKNGLPEKEIKTENGITKECLYFYDEKWNTIRMEYNDNTSFYFIYDFDKNGNIIKKVSQDENKKTFSIYTYILDEKGNIKKQYDSFGDGKTYQSHHYVYDKKNKMIKNIVYDNDYHETVFEYKYDKNGNPIEFYKNNELVSERINEYKKGKLIKSIIKPINGSYTIIHEY